MQQGATRREFLRSTMYATVGSFFATSMAGAGAMVWPVKLSGFGGVVSVPQTLPEIKVGDVIPVREGKFYLTRTEEGLMALYWRCVHLGCTVPFNREKRLFICPCHSSTYELTGQIISGPAPRPLDQMEIKLDGDRILVDTAKIHQRTVHKPEHVTRIDV